MALGGLWEKTRWHSRNSRCLCSRLKPGGEKERCSSSPVGFHISPHSGVSSEGSNPATPLLLMAADHGHGRCGRKRNRSQPEGLRVEHRLRGKGAGEKDMSSVRTSDKLNNVKVKRAGSEPRRSRIVSGPAEPVQGGSIPCQPPQSSLVLSDAKPKTGRPQPSLLNTGCVVPPAALHCHPGHSNGCFSWPPCSALSHFCLLFTLDYACQYPAGAGLHLAFFVSHALVDAICGRSQLPVRKNKSGVKANNCAGTVKRAHSGLELGEKESAAAGDIGQPCRTRQV